MTATESVHVVESYVLDVRVVETEEGYRFEAPQHQGVTFGSADRARLYADVYFDVNGFVEAETGDRGVPPEIVQAGKDTLAAYLLTRPGVDEGWVASFYGAKPDRIQRYVERVRSRAAEIRDRVAAD